MAQNQKNNSEGVYKKISRAVSINPFKPARKEVVLPHDKPSHHHAHVSAAKTKPLKENDHKFTDYIRKMKDKMRTASSVGTAAKSTPTRRDSFNDKVSNYINRAKIKIRTTSNVGEDNRGSSK